MSAWCVIVSSSPSGREGESNMHKSPDSSCGAFVSLGVLSQQLSSQHQGAEGPALGRRSETGDPCEVWQGNDLGSLPSVLAL